ncbi:hypothetical protein V1478_001681 [Vespula squamosa]|uniref:Uncharacterized protein n=1 Tax=Vespula squamosa TaxID=30214 RepID=A0ABD2BXX6_VESSQ
MERGVAPTNIKKLQTVQNNYLKLIFKKKGKCISNRKLQDIVEILKRSEVIQNIINNKSTIIKSHVCYKTVLLNNPGCADENGHHPLGRCFQGPIQSSNGLE